MTNNRSIITEGQLTTRAVALLRRTIEAIQDEDNLYSQWEPGVGAAYRGGAHVCGAPACICGWMWTFAYIRMNKRRRMTANYGYRAVGLTQKQWNRLFDYYQWPAQFQSSSNPTPATAVARINHFIETNGKE